jgi:hypothetical protein
MELSAKDMSSDRGGGQEQRLMLFDENVSQTFMSQILREHSNKPSDFKNSFDL